MNASIAWILMLAVLIGHFGLFVALYNRANALGLPRATIKLFTRCCFVLMWALPVIAWIIYRDVIGQWLSGTASLGSLPSPLWIYGVLCLVAWVVFGIPWLIWRPIFGVESIPVSRDVDVIDVQSTLGKPLALTSRCRWHARLPLNEIFDLAIERMDLPVVGLPAALDGYKVAQLSDVHLTGHIDPEFTRYVVEQATAWEPDLMMLSGDIIDHQDCVDWLAGIFSVAQARDGCFFVLGNHDTRIVDSRQTRHEMHAAGWVDLGGRAISHRLRDVPAMLIGNEHPWFARPVMEQGMTEQTSADAPSAEQGFRVLLSHSPDQIWWARQHRVTLMLAGHTHGGQGRLPLAGPVLGPSFHGSRFASGSFFKSPTTMHVSRGLGGTHLMRINCPPELSLLTLRRPG